MDCLNYLYRLKCDDIPDDVKEQVKRCLRDIIATAAGAMSLPTSAQGEALVRRQYGKGVVPLWFKDWESSAVGAAFYNALAIDSLDFHDGFRPCKGHAGATVVPAAIGACAGRKVSGEKLITALLIGYEIACRAGLAVHALYEPAYHSSGSWAALGAAAAAAYIMDVPAEKFDEILGITEYYAPMSPMLRCTIHPGAVKDGAAAGAWAAATALEMFTVGMPGVPSIFTSEPVAQQQMSSLADEWLIMKQYFKPYPVCRWAQPAVEGVRHLQQKHTLNHTDIESVEVAMFAEGASLGRKKYPPLNSDDAQYNIAWAVAAMLVTEKLGVEQVSPANLTNRDIIDLGHKIKTSVAPDIQENFPSQCLSRVIIALKDGRILKSPTMSARGDYDNPLSDAELEEKYDSLVYPALGRNRGAELKKVIGSLEKYSADDLLDMLT